MIFESKELAVYLRSKQSEIKNQWLGMSCCKYVNLLGYSIYFPYPPMEGTDLDLQFRLKLSKKVQFQQVF